MIKAVIIDDEKAGVDNLKALMCKYCPQVKIVGECSDIIEAQRVLAIHEPQIVFLDIEMPFGNGLDLLALYDTVPFEVIFVTAFEKYALQAIRLSACDYILKPIDIHELINAVNKAVERTSVKKENQNLKQLMENIKDRGRDTKIALPTMQGMLFVKISEVVYCEANGSYTWFYFEDRDKLLVTKNLGEYEELLADNGFIRIHHAYLINTQHITELIKGNSPTVVLCSKVSLSVSQRKRDVLQEYVESLSR